MTIGSPAPPHHPLPSCSTARTSLSQGAQPTHLSLTPNQRPTLVPHHDRASYRSTALISAITSGIRRCPSTDKVLSPMRFLKDRESRGEERDKRREGKEKREEMEEKVEERRTGSEQEGKKQGGEEGRKAGAISKLPTPPLTSHQYGQASDKGHDDQQCRHCHCALVHMLANVSPPCPARPYHGSTRRAHP